MNYECKDKKSKILKIPGCYILEHPFYENTIKIGCSTNISERINSSCYRTMFLEEDSPKLISYLYKEGFESDPCIRFIENCIHNFFIKYRISEKRELFKVDINREKIKYRLKCFLETLFVGDYTFSSELKIKDEEDEEDEDKEQEEEKEEDDEEDEEDEDDEEDEEDEDDEDDDEEEQEEQEEDDEEDYFDLDDIEIPDEIIYDKKYNILGEIEYNKNLGIIEPLSHQIDILEDMKNFFKKEKKGKLILPCGYGKMFISLFHVRDSDYNLVVILVPSLILMREFYIEASKILKGWKIYKREGEIIEDIKTCIICPYNSQSKISSLKPDMVIYDEAHRTCVNKIVTEDSMFHDTIKEYKKSNKIFMTATEKITAYNEDEDDEEEIKANYSMDREEYGEYISVRNFEEAIEQNVICDYTIAIPSTENNMNNIDNSDIIDVIDIAIKDLCLNHMLVYSNTVEAAKNISEEVEEKLSKKGITSYYLDGKFGRKKIENILKKFKKDKISVLCSCKVLQEGISIPKIDSVYFSDNKTSEIDITQMIGRCLRLHKNKTIGVVILPSSMLNNNSMLNTLIKMDPRNKKRAPKLIGLSKNKKNFEENSKIIRSLSKRIDFIRLGRRDGIFEYKVELIKKYEKITGKNIIQSSEYKKVRIGTFLGTCKKNYKKDKLSEERLNKLLEVKTFREWKEEEDKGEKKDKIVLSFDKKVDLMKKYEKLEQKNIICNLEYKNVKIGSFLDICKTNYKKNKLSKEKLNKLLETKTFRDWKEKEDKRNKNVLFFDQKIELIKKYEKNTGKNITQNSEYKNVKIGNFLGTCKQNYKKDKLPEKKLNKLLETKTFRDWKEKEDKRNKNVLFFDQKIELIKKYEKLEQKNIKHNLEYKNVKIGIFLNDCKMNYKKDKLSEERLNKLLEVNTFREWKEEECKRGKTVSPFNQKIELMKKYEKLEQKNIKHNLEYKDAKIGMFLNNCKTNYKKNNLPEERLNKLLETNTFSEWKEEEDKKEKKDKTILSFHEKVDLMKKYENFEQKNIIQSLEYKNVKIGNFLNDCKQNYKKDKLSEERLNKLLEVKTFSEWKEEEDKEEKKEKIVLSFGQKIELIKKYEKNTGKNITQSLEYKNVKIGIFLSYCKRNYKKGKLSEERLNKLLEINTFREWKKEEDKGEKIILSFDEKINLMKEYEKSTGKNIVYSLEYKNVKIGKFLSKCKQNYKKDNLSEERLNKLLEVNSFSEWKEEEDKGEKIVLSFNEKVELMKKYEKITGKNIKESLEYKNVKIGSFLNTCKKNYKKDNLSEERLNKLLEVKTFSKWLSEQK